MAAISLPAVVVPILGPVVGGLILQAASWRWIFLINVPIGLLAFVLAWRGLDRDQDRQRRPLDVAGLVLFVPGAVALLYALTRVAQLGVRPGAWVPLALGVLLLAGFAVYAARVGDAAMLDVRLFRVRSFAASSALLFLSGLSLYGVAFLLPLFYQQVRGYSALTAGLLLAPQGIGSLAARRSVGKLSDRYGPRPVVLAGVVCALVGSLPFGWAGVHGGQVPQIAGLVVRGAGLSAVNIAVMVAAFQGLSKDRIPHASSTTRILLQVGGSFGVAVAAVVLQHELAGHPGGPVAHASGFGAAFLWMTAFTVVAVPPALMLPGRRRPEPEAAAAALPVTPAGSEAQSRPGPRCPAWCPSTSPLRKACTNLGESRPGPSASRPSPRDPHMATETSPPAGIPPAEVPAAERPVAPAMRADARRNRARVLKAAQEAFASVGLQVGLDEIARRAGVGAGTVYRHFPTKEALFDAVILDRAQRLVDRAEELADAPEPGAAFFAFISGMHRESAAKRDLIDAVAGIGVDITASLTDVNRGLWAAVEVLMRRAQQAGTVRTDVDITLLKVLLRAVFIANDGVGGGPKEADGVMAVICDGLRAQAAR
ncbi:hypothetical protein CcI156_21635 [Frankia sp. CcI156]|uniref:MFS transporter n=1 Tax=unclassified Frankia TaxID=2632575 RepID=UPI0003D01966|nr:MULTISPECIES: MFS transporter [unclassified Frankia]OAA18591.1 transcriptional regulator, TetR family [Frankia casuarinae]ESZ99941.1 transcriptional regulator [Frankia sp. CcI6]KFB02708.1 transcriptional regulator, TetR family [Frankia sp. Allo2]OFB38966.1 hypothetical protein Manayef4_21070 [Frankia sp. CgIM4]OHV49249.1 hypothetical protein CgIS1_21335 [Frankia sp. CgIS1]